MNIFRTIASGKHAFREEFVSAFLAYLLSPKMDHGLGFTVLSRLLTHVAEKNQAKPLNELASQFKSRLWENIFAADISFPVVELEFSYQGGFIDVVIKIDNWFIMIENKIIQSSKRENQIKEQYKGLQDVLHNEAIRNREFGENYRILIIYLVPATQSEGGWSVSPSFYNEIDKVELRESDFKALVSWQPATDETVATVSIISIIREILSDEANGMIAPINMEVRHALLSLVDFAIGEFQGFYYEKAAVKKNGSPKHKVADVLKMSGDYYVGIQYGRGGVVDNGWKNPEFLNTEVTLSEESRGWQYLPIEDFIVLVKWSIDPYNQTLEKLTWANSPFATKNLYRVAKYGKPKMYIGIKGGLKALQDMTPEQIRERTVWQLSSAKKSSEWMTCEDFFTTLEAKGISYE
ncbi:MAG: hypothetical protein CVU55_09835 [Deltaproteobacteria bacterium HGW-Deltaproteobacteria-13]|jgi:hypothetical protein|nr:MAG: hypothetical protein CVU55_09835 [Deltaproteobacteria bacterium HGW-Deltaproteobacteria-13]